MIAAVDYELACLALSTALELGGIAVTVADIREAGARIKRYNSTGYVLHLRAAGQSRSAGAAALSGPPPTLAERVETLERKVASTEAVLQRTEDALRAEFEKSLSDVLGDYDQEVRARLGALAKLATDDPHCWVRRYLGPLLIAAGIAFSLAAAAIGVSR